MAIDQKTETGTWRVKSGLAQMLKGGVIMDVVTARGPPHRQVVVLSQSSPTLWSLVW